MSTFETTIRALGGMLASHALLARAAPGHRDARVTLAAAVELGVRLVSAWQHPYGVPAQQVNLAALTDSHGMRDVRSGSIADSGTLALEFTQLARVRCTHAYHQIRLACA